jgi:5-methylcytosine-specific restriction protein A
MAAVILRCSADRLLQWNYPALVGQLAASGRFLERWRLASCPDLEPGTEAWLLLQGTNDAASGLIGHGWIASVPYQADAGGGPGATDWFVAVVFDSLLPLGEQIRPGILGAAIPDRGWGGAGGPPLVTVPPSYEPVLRRMWRDYGPSAADPAEVAPGTLPPEATSAVLVNRWERDGDARRACLAFHGTSCAACGFMFESAYGGQAADAIAVHHVVPPAMLDSGYQLDPIADLIPLCRNCHAVAHGTHPPRTLAELRSMISGSGHISGGVVSDAALQAQEDARRILRGPA